MFFEEKKKYVAPEMDVIETDYQGSLLSQSSIDIIDDDAENSTEN